MRYRNFYRNFGVSCGDNAAHQISCTQFKPKVGANAWAKLADHKRSGLLRLTSLTRKRHKIHSPSHLLRVTSLRFWKGYKIVIQKIYSVLYICYTWPSAAVDYINRKQERLEEYVQKIVWDTRVKIKDFTLALKKRSIKGYAPIAFVHVIICTSFSSLRVLRFHFFAFNLLRVYGIKFRHVTSNKFIWLLIA